MRILKSFPVQDKKTEQVSKVFDAAITKFDYPWRFDRIELHVRDENKVMANEEAGIIVLDYNDIFIQAMDAKGIAVLILRALFTLITREACGSLPTVIEDIIANREMIKRGYGEALVYYYYQKKITEQRHTTGLEDDVVWLSFYIDDKYNADFFRQQKKESGRQDVRNLVECLKQDLADREKLGTALRLYYVHTRKAGAEAAGMRACR
ncbi:MAG: hypothetical protein HY514_03385 [Candidatus Aenigmarchaeota archaeon]|nr:hypothetical protein [Candidatus Aenigmarchaeota archaeon]